MLKEQQEAARFLRELADEIEAGKIRPVDFVQSRNLTEICEGGRVVEFKVANPHTFKLTYDRTDLGA